MRKIKSILILAGAALVVSCGGRESTAPDSLIDDLGADQGQQGTEGNPCYPNNTCNTGLVCKGGLCVKSSSDAGADGPALDGTAPADSFKIPDGYGKLAPCSTPGQPCKASDPCAMNPICGADKLCYPTMLQNCDDGLTCTTDVCKGLGLCGNTPKSGFCAVTDTSGSAPKLICAAKGTKKEPGSCQACDPAISATKWSGVNGGPCDDKNSCTTNDYCLAGVCKGTDYSSKCIDNLTCTTDGCDGKGGCLKNTLKSAWCLISGLCYKDNINDPTGACNKCDVTKSQTAWTPITDACQIGLPPLSKCYANKDKHTGGCAECDTIKSKTAWTVTSGCMILNTCYKSGATDSTGCSTCDPTQSTSAWSLVSNVCQIGLQCYKNGDLHTGGCAKCTPATNPKGWTVTSGCLINNTCYTSGATNATGCGVCNPTLSKTAWSPVANNCLIAGKCYTNGTSHSSGCMVCDTTKNPTGWTPKGTATLKSYGFESGAATGWTLTNTDTKVGWHVSKNRPSGGTYSLYYGDSATKTYDAGATNSGTAAMPSITLTAGKKAALSFMVYMDTEAGVNYDRLDVLVGTTTLWSKASYTTTQTWQAVTVDLSSYAGQTITITYSFNTVDNVSNSTEGAFIDDISIYDGC